MNNKIITAGDLRLNRYECNKGEGLPLHDHDEDSAHLIFVSRGSVLISGSSITSQVLKAGAIYDFPAHSPHEIIAEEDETVFFNIPKRVK